MFKITLPRFYESFKGAMQMRTVITIARQYGSGGREIGRRLAEKFQVPFYDKELIALAAEKSGMDAGVLLRADEKATSSLLYSLVMGDYSFAGGVPFVNNKPVNDRLFSLQAEIIREAAEKGPCIIVGRCADDILSGRSNVMSVFIYADKQSRLGTVTGLYGVDKGEASKVLVKQDKQRANYYQFYTGRKWGKTENYDLCVNSSAFGADGSAELISKAVSLFEL